MIIHIISSIDWFIIIIKVLHHNLLLFLFSHPVMSNSLQPHGLQHTRPSCPSLSPKVCPGSCPFHRWCCPAISSPDTLFSCCPQSFPASGTFPMSLLFASDDQNTGASASASVLPWVFRVDLPYDWLVWSPCCPRDVSGVFSSTTFQKHHSLAFCLLYGPALTTLRDHWEDRGPDYTDLCRQSDVSAFQHTA